MARGRFKKPKPLATGRAVSTTLPALPANLVRFAGYVAAQENRVKLLLRERAFGEVVGAVDEAYKCLQGPNGGITPGLARICLLCHQSFFAAGAAIFRGNPHESAAASRRAIEAARTALAVLHDPENAKRWAAYEERMSRWESRRAGGKPPTLKIEYEALGGDSTAETLARFGGLLSDASLHFTPELLSRLDFKQQSGGKRIYSEYLETRESELASHLAFLAAIHLIILGALDRCAEHNLSMNAALSTAMEGIKASAAALKLQHPFELPPEAAKLVGSRIASPQV